MVAAACAVGRLGEDGPWLGFAPSLDDGYELVVADAARAWRARATTDELLCLAIAYFEDALPGAPEELAATHADIGALVRHLAAVNADPRQAPLLSQAVDAIDDGLAADVVIAALQRCLGSVTDPVQQLERRAAELAAA